MRRRNSVTVRRDSSEPPAATCARFVRAGRELEEGAGGTSNLVPAANCRSRNSKALTDAMVVGAKRNTVTARADAARRAVGNNAVTRLKPAGPGQRGHLQKSRPGATVKVAAPQSPPRA